MPSTGAAALAVAALLALTAGLWHWQVVRRLDLSATSVAHLRRELALSASMLESPGADFAQRLPANLSIDPVVSEFQRSSGRNGVTFVSVSAAPRDATVQMLGRTALSVTLRGSYPNLKIVLGESMACFPALVLQHMALRRLASPNELEAHLELLEVTRPLPASVGR
jgi:hypothetical protein